MRTGKASFKYILRVFVLVLRGLLLVSPAIAAGDNVLAEIDGKKLTQKDFDAYLALFKGNARYNPTTLEGKKRMLQHFIDRTLLLQAAKKEGYEKLDVLKKHPVVDKVEEETIILRAYLQDHVSKKVAVSPEEIAAYKKAHPGMKTEKVKELLAARQQKILFDKLMKRLRAEHTIRVYPENLR